MKSSAIASTHSANVHRLSAVIASSFARVSGRILIGCRLSIRTMFTLIVPMSTHLSTAVPASPLEKSFSPHQRSSCFPPVADPKRGQVKLNIRRAEKEAFDRLCEDVLETPQIAVATKLFRWFMRQSDPLQRIILGLYGEQTPNVALQILQEESKPATNAAGEDHAREPTPGEKEQPPAPQRKVETGGKDSTVRKKKRPAA